jgi:hypothetical protein
VEIGGQVQRHDAPTQALTPFAATFPAPFDVSDEAQVQDLDWGDGRDVKLTWRPGGAWSLSAAYRWGKTNGAATTFAQVATDPVCAFGGPFASRCASTDPAKYQFTHFSRIDRADASAADHEEHEIVDFAVHHDLGIGLGRSTVGLGLRYAKLDSASLAGIKGIPDWSIPEGFFDVIDPYGPPVVTHTIHLIEASAKRRFAGMGPAVSWDASLPLLDAGDAGHVDLDGSISGAVLFGNQETTISATHRSYRTEASGFKTVFAGNVVAPKPTITDAPPISIRRSDDATVPNLAASLGLSYNIGAFTAGAGYRWERYFDAIDGGFPAAEDVDRTIDGPYFKLSVGFGG